MKNILSPDGFFIKFLSALFDCMVLSWLFVLCSVPIFTIGAAGTAVYTVIFQKLKGNDCHILPTFFKAFKENFFQATVCFVPLLAICSGMTYCIYIVHMIPDCGFSFIQYPAVILMFLAVSFSVFIYPQLALFDSPLSKTLKNSLLLCISNFPTVFMFLVLHTVIVLCAFISPKATYLVISIMPFIGFGLLAYFFCIFYRRIFQKVLRTAYEKTHEGEEIDDDDLGI